jgi:hypothetical protein
MMSFRPSRPATALALFLLMLVVPACGSGNARVHPVHGRVTFNGQPTPGAMVVFHPAAKEMDNAARPSGQVGPDGSFSLSTFRPNDGAPEGEYNVAIVWLVADAKPDPTTEETPNRLPPRYSDPRTSDLHAKVSKGKNELPAFELTP